MRIRKRRLTALILTACLLLSCGARRHHSNAKSQEQSQQRTTLERAAQLQSRRQEEVETERQPMERIAQRLRIGYLIFGLLIVIGATTLIWRSVWLRTRSILRKDIVLRQS